MSYPENPKSPAIGQMLLKFYCIKEIMGHMNVRNTQVYWQINRLGLHREFITDEEQQMLLAYRKQRGLIRDEKPDASQKK